MIFELLILLAAARLAAEVAERVSIPAVAAEITVGILLGPSLLGLAGNHESLHFLGELGVLLLLLQVGLELDLGELVAVGRAALVAAVIGVALPFAGGATVALASGTDGVVAVFLGASLTATSVGITARVFGDLRRLGTVEARTVLGAAVADDVLGLLILTIVSKVVTTGTVHALGLAGVAVVALGFVAVATVAGARALPGLVALAERRSRVVGAVLLAGIVVCLAFAELAGRARLAPIVGAFLAGLGLARSPAAERLRREVAPLGQVLIPVFFVQIGVQLDIAQMMRADVIVLAGGLLVVAVLGKLAAGIGAAGHPGDKLLIGLGVLPRGEVGLIFASLGLSSGVLDDRLYAALLVVVLMTTLVAPPLLRARIQATRAVRTTAPVPTAAPPYGKWLELGDGKSCSARHPAPGRPWTSPCRPRAWQPPPTRAPSCSTGSPLFRRRCRPRGMVGPETC